MSFFDKNHPVLSDIEREKLETSNKIRKEKFYIEVFQDALSIEQANFLFGDTSYFLLAQDLDGLEKFPLWQFDMSQPDFLVTGMDEILKELGSYFPLIPIAKAGFLLNRNIPCFEGFSPLQILQNGCREDIEELIYYARGVGGP